MYASVHSDIAWKNGAHQKQAQHCDLVITATWLCSYMVEPNIRVVGSSIVLNQLVLIYRKNLIVGCNHHMYLHHTKPTFKVNSLHYKYNVAVAYYIP